MVKRNDAASVGVLVIGTLVTVLVAEAAADGGYMDTTVVREEVKKAIGSDRGVGAALIRLLFHDCWVNGCDGSVMLNSISGMERDAAKNTGLRGFNVVDAIKARLPGASCADILVFAAREAVFNLSRGQIYYDVKAGRGDGVSSSAAAANATLPGSTFSFQQLAENFAAKNFSVEELVVLSGAHSVGVCHRSSFKDRFLNAPESQINSKYRTIILTKMLQPPLTPEPTVENNIRDMDGSVWEVCGYNTTGEDMTAKGVLDNSYYNANLQNMVLLNSDWVLRTTSTGEDKLKEYRDKPAAWNSDFGDAMAKLSNLKPVPGTYTEVRRSCSRTN